MAKLCTWEQDVTGKPVSIVHWGHFWGNNGSYRPWSNANTNNARSHGSMSKPMMIGEFGSVEQGAPAGGSKANWFTDALSTQLPGKYKGIRAAVYFDFQFDGVDWRIETSQAAKDAWRAGIASAYYYPNQFGSITGKVAVP
jgi:hypothetical protein